MPRKKMYNAKTLRRAIDEYFGGISRLRVLSEMVPTGQVTDKGVPIFEPQTIYNIYGEPVTVLEFVSPPSLRALRLALGISHETWSKYASDPKLGPICAEAKTTVEAYLEQQLMEHPKAARGIIFNLQANFGWKEKREVGLDEPTRQAMATTMTMDEKLALLSEAAGTFLSDTAAAGGDDGAEAVE